MLRGGSQAHYGGTPRHRTSNDVGSRVDAGAFNGSPSKDPSAKRSKPNSKLMVMVVALALAVIVSFSVFSSSSSTLSHRPHHQKNIQRHAVVPGKRHRKLERHPDELEQQLNLAADEASNTAQAQRAGDDSTAIQASQQQGQEQQGAKAALPVAVADSQGAAMSNEGQEQQPQQEQKKQQEQEQPPQEQQPQQQAQQERHQEQAVQQQGQQQQAATASSSAALIGDAGDDARVESEGDGGHVPGGIAGDQWEAQVPQAQDGLPQQQRRRKSPYQQALERCETLACLKEAAAQNKRYKGQFLFPHFLIIGWQKCATTSLFHHLKDHPHVLMPIEKEPEFLSYDCNYDPEGCPQDKQREYIYKTLHLERTLRHNLYSAMFEGSTHYAREGHHLTSKNTTFARSVFQVFPWVRLIASLREPISRYLSMLGHNLDKNTYTCLNKHETLFECLELELPRNNYSTPIQAWLDAYPRQQIMLLQYESLTAEEKEVEHLKAVKSFLGIDPGLPAKQLAHSNTRAARLGHEPEGWPMKKWQYERLINAVRPDVDSLAAIIAKYGLGDAREWVANWEAAWQANLGACDEQGDCSIH